VCLGLLTATRAPWGGSAPLVPPTVRLRAQQELKMSKGRAGRVKLGGSALQVDRAKHALQECSALKGQRGAHHVLLGCTLKLLPPLLAKPVLQGTVLQEWRATSVQQGRRGSVVIGARLARSVGPMRSHVVLAHLVRTADVVQLHAVRALQVPYGTPHVRGASLVLLATLVKRGSVFRVLAALSRRILGEEGTATSAGLVRAPWMPDGVTAVLRAVSVRTASAMRASAETSRPLRGWRAARRAHLGGRRVPTARLAWNAREASVAVFGRNG